MPAPVDFARWLSTRDVRDKKYRHRYKYHPRSDAHSISLCEFILADLLQRCEVLRAQAARHAVAYGINAKHIWPNGKRKTIDLAIGLPGAAAPEEREISGLCAAKDFTRVLLSCEAKTVMTEHGKSQPRIFDELSSSHEIVHQGSQEAIAAGITVVNIASTFVSPLRQTSSRRVQVSEHRQPAVTESMVRHLRGLPIREGITGVGFDAYCTFVVDCDNVGSASLWTAPPAPQPGDRDHYDTFIDRMARFYADRFSSLS